MIGRTPAARDSDEAAGGPGAPEPRPVKEVSA